LEFSPEGNSQMSAHRRFLFASYLALNTLCWRSEAQISMLVSQPPTGQTAKLQPQAGKLTLAAAIDAAEANYPRTRVALEQRNSAQAAIGVARAARRHSLDFRPGDCEQQHSLSMEQRRGHSDFMATI
jgi:outer membrane protein TolC